MAAKSEVSAPPETGAKEFHVSYAITGIAHVNASSENDANKTVFASLHTLVGKAGTDGVNPEEAKEVGFADADVEIHSIESATGESWPVLGREAVIIPPEMLRQSFFPIASTAREDLEILGYDASQLPDADMQNIARELAADYFAQLYWSSLKRQAETLDLPGRTPLAPEP
jgi:hypothetical protein